MTTTTREELWEKRGEIFAAAMRSESSNLERPERPVLAEMQLTDQHEALLREAVKDYPPEQRQIILTRVREKLARSTRPVRSVTESTGTAPVPRSRMISESFPAYIKD